MGLRTTIYLTCDECKNPFPAVGICPAPMDGAIFDAAQVRRDAKEEGWTRRVICGVAHDFCAACDKKVQRRMKAAK
jgi:hypothetical protein